MASKELERFLRNVFLLERPEGQCIRLTLKHIAKGSNDVANYNIGEADKVTDDFMNALQTNIEADALTDASGLGGVQKYQLLSYHAMAPEKNLGRHVFRSGEPDSDEDAFDTEPANEKGLVAQAMRHTEALMRSQVVASNQVMNIMAKTLEKVSFEKEKLMEDRFRNMEMIEKLLSANHERMLLEQKAEFEMMMKRKLGETLMLLGPTVVNRMVGTNLLPETVRPQDMMLKSFSESITPDQFIKLQQVFTPEQLTVVYDLMKSTQKGEEEGK